MAPLLHSLDQRISLNSKLTTWVRRVWEAKLLLTGLWWCLTFPEWDTGSRKLCLVLPCSRSSNSPHTDLFLLTVIGPPPHSPAARHCVGNPQVSFLLPVPHLSKTQLRPPWSPAEPAGALPSPLPCLKHHCCLAQASPAISFLRTAAP